jgi:hypothetical protein
MLVLPAVVFFNDMVKLRAVARAVLSNSSIEEQLTTLPKDDAPNV